MVEWISKISLIYGQLYLKKHLANFCPPPALGPCALHTRLLHQWLACVCGYLILVDINNVHWVWQWLHDRWTFETNQLLDCPRFSTEFAKRSFSYLVSTMMNNLSLGARLSPTIDTFKHHLMAYLLHSLPVLPGAREVGTIFQQGGSRSKITNVQHKWGISVLTPISNFRGSFDPPDLDFPHPWVLPTWRLSAPLI